MERADAHRLPARDPIAGGPLVITEVEAVESGVTIRGRFEVPRFARLSPDQARYLETFLRCRGMLNSVERELGISYPTARARLDAVLKALDLHAVREDNAPAPEPTPSPEAPPEPSFEFPGGHDALPEEKAAPSEGPLEEEPRWEDVADEVETAYDAPLEEAPVPIEPEPEPSAESATTKRSREELLSLLERGEISVDELKKELAGSK